MRRKKILTVVTNQATYGAGEHRTGLWPAELVHFYDKAVKAGHTVDVVSPTGGEVPLDPRSLGPLFVDKTVRGYLDDPAFMDGLKSTAAIAEADPDDYCTIFFTTPSTPAAESSPRSATAPVPSSTSVTPHAVRDGRLITGQNPVSTKAVSDLIPAASAESE
ncbi:hypothetical protein [Streptomyces sp. NRRL S-474]|uniref:hypothetical protein n=1 Tax=Streptomyces sp. NRRL S-474 TaxID=1463909 RepID=UPI00069094D9|nr:hypothetical protein [Streptomyces sp. NRRL S-474]